MVDESEADDGGIHRFWRFRNERFPDADVDDLVTLLFLILIFDQIQEQIAEPV
jgi:hypothetical protein